MGMWLAQGCGLSSCILSLWERLWGLDDFVAAASFNPTKGTPEARNHKSATWGPPPPPHPPPPNPPTTPPPPPPSPTGSRGAGRSARGAGHAEGGPAHRAERRRAPRRAKPSLKADRGRGERGVLVSECVVELGKTGQTRHPGS